MSYKLLHVHGQMWQHEEVLIEGNREGLEELKVAIEKALASGVTEKSDTVFVNDGEGFDVKVKCIKEEEIASLPLPYCGSYK